MKKLTFVLLMLFVVTSVTFAQKSIAVSTFDVMGGAVTKDEAEAITELFISELVSTGKVNVVDRANFDKVIAEMKFQNSDWSNSEKTVSLGNAVNASLVIRGKIMKVGSSMYLSSTVIDLNTANVLSSAREQFNSIDDIFGLLTNYANQTINGLSLKIGDIGPGGGIVFYIEGKKAYEVSEILGEANWETAKTMAKNFNGGGYSDWYLPTDDQLNLVYMNLRKPGKISGNTWHWSSTEVGWGSAWHRCFSDGKHRGGDYDSNDNTYSVRAVRAFNMNSSSSKKISNNIGDDGPGGGIVFYYSEEGFDVYQADDSVKRCNYLEVSKTEVADVTWCSRKFGGYCCSINTNTGLGFGKMNTYKIINGKHSGGVVSSSNCAAKVCAEYSTAETTKGDWFLPSKDELNLLYKNLGTRILATSTEYWLWSSSEYDDYSAWSQRSSDGLQHCLNKYYTSSVRAIRAF